MDSIERRRFLKVTRKRLFSLSIGSPQKIIVTGMVVALVVSMGVLGASGKLFQPVPSYDPYVNHGTYHVIATPAAIPVGGTTSITALVNSYIHDTKLDVNVSIMGPGSSTIIAYELASITTDSHGKGSVALYFPGLFKGTASTSVIGTYTVVAAFAQVYSSVLAYTHFTVFNKHLARSPQIFMNPGFGPSGTYVSLHGYHFSSDSNVSLYYDGSHLQTSSYNISTDSSGSFLANFKVPQSSGLNTLRAQDQFGDNASSFFQVQQASEPGPRLISSTYSPIDNGSSIANFTSTLGVKVVLMGVDASNGAYSQTTVSHYSAMPNNITKPNLDNSQFYDVMVLKVSGGNATISINTPVGKNQSANSMEFWNGTAWISAGSVSESGNTITGVIPVKDLGGTMIVIGHIPGPSHVYEYVAILILDTIAAITIPTIIHKRKKK